jgi:ABC-type lipoprotein release transport system permease subunit
MNVVVRSSADPTALTGAVKQQLRALDSDLPLYNVITMEQRVHLSLARRRFVMLLLAGSGCISLALAAIGIYGVLAYLVSQGTREIGIRMALGATRTAILRLVLRNGLALALTGLAMGVVAALLLTRLMQSLLFGVTAGDPLTFYAVPVLLLFIALLAFRRGARRRSIQQSTCGTTRPLNRLHLGWSLDENTASPTADRNLVFGATP